MTAGLPSSGQLDFSMVNVELLKKTTYTNDLNNDEVRLLAEIPSGQISMSQLQGKRWISPGSQTFNSPNGSWPIPRYQYMTATLYGAGGGGGGGGANDGFVYGYAGGNGGAGGSSSFYGISVSGGGGGWWDNQGGQSDGNSPHAGYQGGNGQGGYGGPGGAGNGLPPGGPGGAGGSTAGYWDYTYGPPWYGGRAVSVGGGGAGGSAGGDAWGTVAQPGEGGGGGKVVINWS